MKSITIQEKSAIKQYFAASVVFQMWIIFGAIVGWNSPSTAILTSDESPLPSGKITMDEASWISSLVPIGALPANILSGLLINSFGRKWLLVALSVPSVLSWLLIIFAQNVYFLYAARILHGFFAGGMLAAPVYLIEIANDRVRGTVSSMIFIGSGLGVLSAYAMGNYFNFYSTPMLCIALTCSFAVLFAFMLPETPIYLVRQNKITEAEKSLRFYKDLCEHDFKYINLEIERLKSIVGAIEVKKSDSKRLQWSDFTTKSGNKAIILSILLLVQNQFSGITAMLNYSSTIFEVSGSAMSPNTSSMIVEIVKLLGTFVVISLIDRAGRRFLYIVSSIGTAFGQLTLGIFIMLNAYGFDVEAFNWVPIVSFAFSLFVSAFAVQTLHIVVIAELLPEELKEIGVTLTNAMATSFSIVILKCLPLLGSSIGFHGCMFFFAAICLTSVVFIIKYLPETKGKSYEQIMESLR